jgi:hypothetical protein
LKRGIELSDVVRSTVQGNSVRDFKSFGILIDDVAGGIVCASCLVVGNRLHAASSGSSIIGVRITGFAAASNGSLIISSNSVVGNAALTSSVGIGVNADTIGVRQGNRLVGWTGTGSGNYSNFTAANWTTTGADR